MKKLFFMLCLLALSVSTVSFMPEFVNAEEDDDFAALIDADKMDYQNTPINKFGRGVINTATCWAEVPAEVCKVSKERDPLLGSTLGLAEGVVTGLVRGATGIFDMLTCVIPPYDKPVMKPEYAITRADEKFKEYLW